MGKWRRRGAWLAVVLVAGGAAYYALVLHSPAPSSAFDLDVARIRALAESLPGDKPVAVRYEEVLALRFFEAMTMAGEPWQETPMPVYAYQLVFPDRTIVIDTAHGHLEWINAVVGVWLILAPFILGYTAIVAALWNDIIVGVVVIVLATWAATAFGRPAPQA